MKKRMICLIAFIVLSIFLGGCCLSHEWKEATCSAPKTCIKCDKTTGKTIPHTQGEWQITKKAVGSELGLKQAFCTVCGEVIAEETYERTKEDAVKEAQTEAIESAKKELKRKLKNPSSLVINNATFYYGEYDGYNRIMSYVAVKLDYNATNSFGGSVRDTYVYFLVDEESISAEQLFYIMMN